MKTKNFIILLFLASAWMWQSCNVATTVHFNKDYSGTYEVVLDMSDLISMANAMDSTGASNDGQIAEMRHGLDSIGLAEKYNSVSGIHDARATVSDDGVISIGFSFDNVESLNASFKTVQDQLEQEVGEMEEGSNDMIPTELLGGGNQTFKRSGKTMLYSMDASGLGGENAEEGNDMDMFSSMIDYTVELSFDRKIKSVDMEGMTPLEQGNNNVKARVDFANLIKGGKYEISVKTK